ncbi:ABC transporter permease [Pontibacillus yanchengensis]|uniref:Antibiotic ABC transporter permease n=1 Tax=Pontibacillus yanchengensis Y32 TaxID=1385514 RepID=A0A0A2TS89_9BACI|nr:ABC transporter permease [Pontibacillus yanchengensis]KGP72130.1 antibiotic ABC transporter permease [Pontibacillus yanchengensis Y32]
MQIVYNTSKMEVIRMFRNRYFVFFSVLIPILFYAVFTATFGDNLPIAGTQWKAYFLMSMTCFSLMSASVQTFGIQFIYDQTQNWMDWLFTQPIKKWQYFLGRFVSQMVLNLVVIVVLFTAAGLWKNIDLSWLKWIQLTAWIWVGILPFLAMGAWLSVSKNVETASGIANIITLGLALTGGLWMPLEQMPELIQTVGEWMPSHLYAQGAWSLLAGDSISLMTISSYTGYFIVIITGALLTHRVVKKE